MTQDHTSHKYGFFKEVALRYCEEVLGELSLIKTQEPSILNTLEEITATKNSIVSHAGKCQDDIDDAFEEMFSVLQECKQEMKLGVAEHYSSLTGIFECQEEHLKEVQSEMKEVATSVKTSVEDHSNDHHFLRKLESTMTQIKNLKEKLQAAPPTVTKPQLLAPQLVSPETLRHYMKKKCCLYVNLADPKMCTVEGTFLTKGELQVDHQETLILNLYDSNRKTCQKGESRVEADLVSLEGNSTKVQVTVEQVSSGRVKVILTPQRRGQHKLSVKVNGVHITNSPFTVMVSMSPKFLS